MSSLEFPPLSPLKQVNPPETPNYNRADQTLHVHSPGQKYLCGYDPEHQLLPYRTQPRLRGAGAKHWVTSWTELGHLGMHSSAVTHKWGEMGGSPVGVYMGTRSSSDRHTAIPQRMTRVASFTRRGLWTQNHWSSYHAPGPFAPISERQNGVEQNPQS